MVTLNCLMTISITLTKLYRVSVLYLVKINCLGVRAVSYFAALSVCRHRTISGRMMGELEGNGRGLIEALFRAFILRC
jgi:hypothetical protein